MSEKLNLKEIQRKAYTSYHQDGLIDLFASAYIVAFGGGILMDFLWDFSFGVILPGILLALLLPLWIAAKRKITIPRIGFVNFGTKGKAKLTGLFTGLMSLGFSVLFLIVLVEGRSAPWLSFIINNGMIVIGAAGLMACCLFGYALDIQRWYTYGLVALFSFTVGHFIGIFFAYVVFALGVTVAASGVNLLVRFVRKYPLKGE